MRKNKPEEEAVTQWQLMHCDTASFNIYNGRENRVVFSTDGSLRGLTALKFLPLCFTRPEKKSTFLSASVSLCYSFFFYSALIARDDFPAAIRAFNL